MAVYSRKDIESAWENMTFEIIIKGVVQGVGFRPYIYRCASDENINGVVWNDLAGVTVKVDCTKQQLDSFINKIKKGLPPASKIDDIAIKSYESDFNPEKFQIIQSQTTRHREISIPPDLSICSDCKNELFDNKNFRFNYSYINCTNCGPRFTIINDLPYDREKTTMSDFEMCNKCESEYTNVLNRRFHAQPVACPVCGPDFILCDSSGKKLKVKNPIKKTVELLEQGNIVAIKGIGGYHIVCDASNKSAIQKIRKIKNRKYKPLAVMSKNIQMAERYAYINSVEKEYLKSYKKPIVLLEKKKNEVADLISPDTNKIGIMLPYTPVHFQLFDNSKLELLVMTSANFKDCPMIYEDNEVINKFKNKIDNFLIGNRKIARYCDDSIIQIVGKNVSLIRRSRGWTPLPLKIKLELPNVLGLGSEEKNVFALGRNDEIILSQHQGDIGNCQSFNEYKNNIFDFINLFKIKPEIIKYDLHPNFLINEILNEFHGIQHIGVQHHHAHVCSCMLENGISPEEDVIGIAFDGTGYGIDNTIWGSEFLIANYKTFIRAAHLDTVVMQGGNKSIYEPGRMAVSYIDKLNETILREFFSENYMSKSETKNIRKLIKYEVQTIKTSSMGRLFDVVAYLLKLKNKAEFEGHLPVLLESIIDESEQSYDLEFIEINDKIIIKFNKLFRSIVEDLKNGRKNEVISVKFHNWIINNVIEISKRLRKKYKINKVALSGGVWQNIYLFTNAKDKLQKEKFEVLFHKQVPTNDAGISFGQIACGI